MESLQGMKILSHLSPFPSTAGISSIASLKCTEDIYIAFHSEPLSRGLRVAAIEM